MLIVGFGNHFNIVITYPRLMRWRGVNLPDKARHGSLARFTIMCFYSKFNWRLKVLLYWPSIRYCEALSLLYSGLLDPLPLRYRRSGGERECLPGGKWKYARTAESDGGNSHEEELSLSMFLVAHELNIKKSQEGGITLMRRSFQNF